MALSCHSLPITALETCHDSSTVFILAGIGTFLQLFDVRTPRLYDVTQVFETQTIHGVSSYGPSKWQPDDQFPVYLYLVWGGRSLRVVAVCRSPTDSSLTIRKLSQELALDDWIIDVCCSWHPRRLEDGSMRSLSAFIVTSHNVASLVSFECESVGGIIGAISVVAVATGPASMLYSAHMHVVSECNVLVASGTIFGQVVLWTICTPPIIDATQTRTGHLLQTFHGHEGSIFGVHLLNFFTTNPRQGLNKTWIASCSDDRTIRIWEYSERDLLAKSTKLENPTSLLSETGYRSGHAQSHAQSHNQRSSIATAMGHVSRIWDILPFTPSGPLTRFLTFGEDGTSQMWRIRDNSSSTKTDSSGLVIEHEGSRAYHTGRNIWAKALLYDKNRNVSEVVTGGADGRVVSFSVNDEPSSHGVDDVHILLAEPSSKANVNFMNSQTDNGKPQSRTRSLFQNMLGEWTLNRTIKSKLSNYPSGVFRGTARITPKESSNKIYDLECLYEEEGTLTTEQGISLRGSRRYVYRYQEKTDTISAWFVKPESKSVVDYLFHEVKFKTPDQMRYSKNKGKVTKAQGHHLCIDDDYDAEYEFISKSETLEKWSIKYQVVGPKKDYTLNASYSERQEILGEDTSAQHGSEKDQSRTDDEPANQGLSKDSLKSYCWQNATQILATTNAGYVARATLTGKSNATKESGSLPFELSWDHIAHTPDLSFQPLMVGIEQFDAVLLTGRIGIVYGVSGQRQVLDEIIRLPSKVTSLFVEQSLKPFTSSVNLVKTVSVGVVATCVGLSSALVFRLGLEDQSKTGMLLTLREAKRLDLLPKTIVTSACWANTEGGKKLVLGTRSGALHVYSDPHSSESQVPAPFSFINNVHIEDSVTVIQNLPQSNSTVVPLLLTAGRDGRYAIHRLVTDTNEEDDVTRLETVHEGEPPFGPNIEGAMFDGVAKDLVLWGFKGRHFIVWNESKERELMDIDCGGAHRNWTYHRNQDSAEGGRLMWTQASTCHLQVRAQPSHRVLRAGTHGREIKAMTIHPLGEGQHLLATGAEDTTIRIAKYDGNVDMHSEPFKHLGLIKQHRTGIQQLRWSRSGRYLFSAGGYEELYVWRVQSIPEVGIGITRCCQCPAVSGSCDLRVLDFDVFDGRHGAEVAEDFSIVSAVYSDSSLRVSRFPSEQQLELIM